MAIIDRSFTIGEGRTGFLLIHGLGGTPIELKFVAKGLARRGFKVSCCQLAGHCGTHDDLVATGWHDWYASVTDALDRLREDCDTVVVGGLSMGAVLALHLAAMRPKDVHGLALYAPTLWYDGWSTPWYRFMLRFGLATGFGRWIVGRFYRFVEAHPYGIKDPAIRAVVVAAMNSGDSTQAGILVTPGQAVIELNKLVQTVKRELPSITTPAMIVQAREDDLSSLKNTEYLQRHLGGLVDTLILNDSYHIVTVDRQRDLLIDATVVYATLLAERIRMQQGDADSVLSLPATRTAPEKTESSGQSTGSQKL
ncbi:MAG: alpha/beta hydrolase [Xanthobacteraceae bacterium]